MVKRKLTPKKCFDFALKICTIAKVGIGSNDDAAMHQPSATAQYGNSTLL